MAGLAFVCPASAQKNSPLEDSGIVLSDAPQTSRYFDVTGRRSGVFGRQNGQFEAWIYPVKLLHSFRLEFQQESMMEPLRGETLLQRIITRPESTTLVYVHPNFTVQEVIWEPLNEAAVVVQLVVDAAKPLEITAAFVPDFRPMWPASLGGQHTEWLAGEKAFVLTDGTGQPAALIGSLGITMHSEFVDHQLGADEMMLRFAYQPADPELVSQPLVMALSMGGEAKAEEIYDHVVKNAAALFKDRVQAHRRFLERTLTIETPDLKINGDLLWAKVALESGWVCSDEFGCGLVAGYGPSGAGERPGFAWWFGGDALMASWAQEDYGDLQGALQVLRFLKQQQRTDGKMLHELSQSAGLIDWFGKYHYAYYHADTTPMYVYSIDQYWRRTGDLKFLDEFWPSARKAYEYCLSTLSADDGLMDNTKAGLAAVEVGVLRGKVVKDLYLEGFWLAAAEAMAHLAAGKGDKEVAEDALARAARASESLEKQWWTEAQRTYAFGQTSDGHRAELIGAWPAVALALGTRLDAVHAEQAAKSLASPKLTTDWGVRWLTNDSELYDPLSYNNGSAWPFIGGVAAWAEYRHGLPISGFQLWSSLVNLTGLSAPGMLPELMNGDRCLPGEFAVPHQLFSSVGVVLPMVRGLLGIESDFSAASPAAQIRLRPTLPADWPYLRFRNYPVAEGSIAGEIRQETGRTVLRVKSDAKTPITLVLRPAIPGLARIQRVLLDGKPQRFTTLGPGSFIRVEVPAVVLQPSQELTLSVEYQGGIALVPPPVQPQAGERSSSLRVLDVHADVADRGCEMKIKLVGLGGREYGLRVLTTLDRIRAGTLTVHKWDGTFEVRVPFEGSGYVTQEVCLEE